MLSRYPSIPKEEADYWISKIENLENKPICEAILGRINENELIDDAKIVFKQFQTWSQNKTRRIREEQQTARRIQRETQLALKLNKLYEKGVIGEETLILYGISGDLPDRNTYIELNFEEKQKLWSERMENRFGPNWRERFNTNNPRLPFFVKKVYEFNYTNWNTDGF